MNNAKNSQRLFSELGLSVDESRIYSLLLSSGSLSVSELAENMGILPTNIYRLASALQNKGMVTQISSSPKTYQAVPPKAAITKITSDKALSLSNSAASLIEQLTAQSENRVPSMGILTGESELFSHFVKLSDQAKKEIQVISIGEEVPQSIWKSVEHAVSRDVSVRFIFHQNTKDNVLIIKRWQQVGADVRHVPNEGYHLFIFDNETVVISVSNTKNTKERTGVEITSEPIVSAMKQYFEQQWAASVKAG